MRRVKQAAGRDAMLHVGPHTRAESVTNGQREAVSPVPAAPSPGDRITLFGRKVEVTHAGISAYDGSAWMATRYL